MLLSCLTSEDLLTCHNMCCTHSSTSLCYHFTPTFIARPVFLTQKAALLVDFLQLLFYSYQGSESSTSDGIHKVFGEAKKAAASAGSGTTAVVLLDEVGLAEISPHNPLKVSSCQCYCSMMPHNLHTYVYSVDHTVLNVSYTSSSAGYLPPLRLMYVSACNLLLQVMSRCQASYHSAQAIYNAGPYSAMSAADAGSSCTAGAWISCTIA